MDGKGNGKREKGKGETYLFSTFPIFVSHFPFPFSLFNAPWLARRQAPESMSASEKKNRLSRSAFSSESLA